MNKFVKTLKILQEMAEYLDPSLNRDTFLDWFENNVILKDPSLIFDIRKNDGIIYIRNKKSGLINSKFKIDVLEKIDDDLDFEKADLEENEEETETGDESINPKDISTTADLANNEAIMSKIGLGDLSNQAKESMNLFKQAMTNTLSKTNEIAQKIIERNN